MSYAQVAQHHKEKLLREKQTEQCQEKTVSSTTQSQQQNVSTSTTVGRVQPEKEQHKESRGKVSKTFLLSSKLLKRVCMIYRVQRKNNVQGQTSKDDDLN